MHGHLNVEGQDILTITFRRILVSIRNILGKKLNTKIQIHFMFNIFFPENRAFCEIMWKNTVQPDRPQTNALCMPDNKDYKLTLRICNNYCFCTATMITRTRLNITLIRVLPVLLTFLKNMLTLFHILKTTAAGCSGTSVMSCQTTRCHTRERNLEPQMKKIHQVLSEKRGTGWRRWFRHCATSRKIAGSIPDGAIGIFH